MDSFESTVLKKNRRLSQFLIISSLLNVAFLSSAIYQYFKPVKAVDWTSTKTALTEDSQTVLKNFLALSYQELISRLSQKIQIEPGLYKRDLALAVLHDSYHVDIQRALSKPVLSFQQLNYLDGTKQKWLNVPRSLSDIEYEMMVQFLKQEAWPLTAKGLFFKLKLGLKDGSLVQAFYRSNEFSKLFDVFKISIPSLKEDLFCSILLKGDYSDLEQYFLSVRDGGFSYESFLNHYTRLGSSYAAGLLIDLPGFSVKSLSDLQALDLLDTLAAYPDKQKKIAFDLMSSFRSDQFKQEILKKGFEGLVQEEKPQVMLAKAIPIPTKAKDVKEIPVQKTKAKGQKTYVVQEGDSLWKISRKFKVDIETLKTLNQLDSENLKPGKILVLP
jgi:LysM domain